MPQAAITDRPLHSPPYKCHRPEQTLLYQNVGRHYPVFRDVMAAQVKSLPLHVQQEFVDYLKCGQLEHGFLRVQCIECHPEHLVEFSCKRRGLCPSCGARRMAESAALLVDEVLPEQPPPMGTELSFSVEGRFHRTNVPDQQELTELVHTIIHRVAGYLEREGIPERDDENSYLNLEGDEDPMQQVLGCSVSYRIAIGPQQGLKVFTLQSIPAREDNDRFPLGTLKGVGRIYQQTFVDTYSKVAFAKLYSTKTKVRSPQSNGICERFHKTILQEFYQVTFRKKLYADLESLQVDLDEWLMYYNEQRTHQGKRCCGRTPLVTLVDGKRIWKEKSVG